MYKARITKDQSSAIVFMIDQSGSMTEIINFEQQTISKAEVVTQILNSAISEIIYRCQGNSMVYNYFDIGVIGYGGNGVRSLLHAQKDLLPIEKISSMDRPKAKLHKTIIQKGKRRLMTSLVTQWVEAEATGVTPQIEAIGKVIKIATKWCSDHPKSFPMMVFNITDGDFSGCDPKTIISSAETLKELGTEDGKVLFFNINIANREHNSTKRIIFPCELNSIKGIAHGEILYDMSSTLPNIFNPLIKELSQRDDTANSKAMILNGSLNDLFYVLNIGSSTLSFRL